MEEKTIHVISRGTGWAIIREGAEKAMKVYKRKPYAERRAATFLAKGFDVVIHDRSGYVVKWDKPEGNYFTKPQKLKPARSLAVSAI